MLLTPKETIPVQREVSALKPIRTFTSWPMLQRQLESHTRKQRAEGVSREKDPGVF